MGKLDEYILESMSLIIIECIMNIQRD